MAPGRQKTAWPSSLCLQWPYRAYDAAHSSFQTTASPLPAITFFLCGQKCRSSLEIPGKYKNLKSPASLLLPFFHLPSPVGVGVGQD